MDQQAQAARILRARLKETCVSPVPPVFPTNLKWVLDMRLRPRDGGVMIGMLPIELQHLCVLALTLEAEFGAEVHRRCVQLFGVEEYDHEGAEYHIHCEVKKDPRFNQAPKVWAMLERRVYRHWRELLVTREGRQIVFYVDQQFRIFRTKYRIKTPEEILADINAILERT